MPLTTQQVRRSAWARRFKQNCPDQYEAAIQLAVDVGPVVIAQRDDHSARGDFLWVVAPDANPEFWLDGLSTREKALALCQRMQWPLADEQNKSAQ